MKISSLIVLAKDQLLQSGKEEYQIDAEWLLCDVLQMTRSELSMQAGKDLNQKHVEVFNEKLKRRLEGEPLQYILNHQSFYGYDFYVDQRVLIPRFETEELVEKAIHIVDDSGIIDILDLCSGSGCIGISLLKECPNTRCDFVDISTDALYVARRNSQSLEVLNRSHFIHSDLFDGIKKKYQMIVSNPPYIKREVINELDDEVRLKEPKLALDGGEDGLDFYKRIIVESKNYLSSEGYLLLEIGFDQMKDVKTLMAREGYVDICGYKDLSGNDRMVIGKVIQSI